MSAVKMLAIVLTVSGALGREGSAEDRPAAAAPASSSASWVGLEAPGAASSAETYVGRSDVVPTATVVPLDLAPKWRERYVLADGVPSVGPSSPPPGTAGTTPTSPDSKALSWETGTGKSYLIPALDIVGFDFLLNRFDYPSDKETYGVTLSSIRENATRKWVADADPYAVNQFYHPYQGSIYFGSARSAGLNYWESLGYTLGGSLLWEIAGETGPPSYNDQITTGFGGTFLGEPLFRMASLLLEGGDGKPGFWRELGAGLISPPTGFNRLAFGDRFDPVFPSGKPAVFTRLRLGGSLTDRVSLDGVSADVRRREATADFHIAYGLPGKPGYRYTRPFDYFDFQFTALSTNMFENIMSRGLLLGTDYAAGDAYRGVWGLYGNYDYISEQVFRISSTALSLGSTGEWRLSGPVTLQGTLLGGLGYGAAGSIHSTNSEREYHYGATPQALLALRLLLGDVANLDVTGRGFYVSGVASTESQGSEQVLRGDAALTVRIYGHHTLTLKYVASRRDASYHDRADRHDTIGTFSLLYGLVSDKKFGAVGWGADDAQGR